MKKISTFLLPFAITTAIPLTAMAGGISANARIDLMPVGSLKAEAGGMSDTQRALAERTAKL